MTQYKTIVLDRIVSKSNNNNYTHAVRPAAEKIKEEAAGGWEVVAITQVPIYVKPGCLGSLIGKNGFYDYAMLIIYKKEV